MLIFQLFTQLNKLFEIISVKFFKVMYNTEFFSAKQIKKGGVHENI